MKTIWIWMQTALVVAGGAVGWLIGECNGLLIALVIFVLLDYITGVICAVIDKKLSSDIGYRGIAKKTLIFVLVGVANVIDTNVIGSGSALRSAVIFFYLSNEGISILENAAHAGLKIPEKLKSVLKQLHNKNSNDDQGDE